jgi:hypothetical protein
MNTRKPDDDRLACFFCNLNLSGLTVTRVILWLLAITIVSFVIGLGILAVSGSLPTTSENKVSPFRQTAMFTPATTTLPLDGATSGDIRITLGAGELTLQGGAPKDRLMEANVFSKTAEMQPDFSQVMNNSQKTVTMTEPAHKKKEWFALHSPDSWSNNWDIRLNDNVPVAVNVNVGAGHSQLVLGSLNLDSLVVNNGVGDTEIDFGGYHGGPFQAEIHNGVGDLTLRIPRGSNTRILIHHGVGDITMNGFEQNDEKYTTAGFSPALPVNEIIVRQGVGSIQLEAA